MTQAAHLVHAAETMPDAPAVAHGTDIHLTYAGLASRAARLAGALRTAFGLQEGDRVAIITPNCVQYLELLGGIWHAGLIAVPVNAKLHPKEYAHILRDVDAPLCFTSRGLSADIRAVAPDGCALRVIGDAAYEDLFSGPEAPLTARTLDDIAWIFYTSGTTGLPKGACLTHQNLGVMCRCYFEDVDPPRADAPHGDGPSFWRAILHAAPMSHGSGLYALAYVMKGGVHIIPSSEGFDPDEIFDLIEAWPGTAFFAAPTMVRRLTAHPRQAPKGLRTITYGGGPMHVEDCLAALDKFGPCLSQLYGQGESPMTITALNAEAHFSGGKPAARARLGSVGTAQSAVEVRTVDATGAPCPPGEIGEIILRGDSVMQGYWNNPEATAETIKDGWLYTGDMGSFDGVGYLTLKDRSKDVIISGGQNIYPREVEEVLLAHPNVAEVAVLGRPDAEWGESVEAVIVKEGAVSGESLDAFCLEHLARFKRPKHYRFVEALPKNNTGKVLKRALREPG
ncbi:MAG: AMP-binding protein [Pseudomonadota bacterium]